MTSNLGEADGRDLLIATRTMALALIEDLHDIRTVIEQSIPPAGFARRMSGILRRITIADRELVKVATPRIGKIKLHVPDVKRVMHANKNIPLFFWAMGRATFFGISVSNMSINPGPSERADLAGLDPEASAEVNFEGFLGQPCICFQGQWLTRADTLTFAANVGHSIHSLDPKKKPAWEMLQAIRYLMTVHLDGEVPVISANLETVGKGAPPWIGQHAVIDLPMIETLATAHYLTHSPDVLRLEEIIREELS